MTARREPVKWLKYLKLVEYGLVEMEELERDIRRYPIDGAHQVLLDLAQELEKNKALKTRTLYVVKLVTPNQFGKLPNIRIESRRDLESVPEFIRQKTRDAEIWYCRTRIDAGVFSVAGRISFCSHDPRRSQVIEQVWRCSPRLIESYSPNFPHAYARATRAGWGRHYTIEEWHNGREQLAAENQKNDFMKSLLYIERARESLETFVDMLSERLDDHVMYTSVSLEYKIIKDKLSIIDWDTTDDKHIIYN